MIGAERTLKIVRSQGKIAVLEEKLKNDPVSGKIGIAHTRWATHGRPSDENAHPHRSGPFVVVHNGIIENYADIKQQLEGEGFTFASETDTEVIVKLAEREWRRGKDYHALHQGYPAAAAGQLSPWSFINEEHPQELIAARKESPLILGVGADALYLASDVPAILPYTNTMVYLEDGDVVRLSLHGYIVESLTGEPRERLPVRIDWNPVMAEKAGYKHFMLKEIHEQPHAVIDTFRGALDLNRRESAPQRVEPYGIPGEEDRQDRSGCLRDLLPCLPGWEVHDRRHVSLAC